VKIVSKILNVTAKNALDKPFYNVRECKKKYFRIFALIFVNKLKIGIFNGIIFFGKALSFRMRKTHLKRRAEIPGF
jgi:hypothetical protein